jgi:ferric-dicitrate binding protein FerR (iron transport regulator)
MKNMEKNKAYKILLRLRDGMLTEEQREQIVCWLGSGQDAEEKETALFRIWEEAKAEAGEASDASLQATWQKIASTEKQVSRRRLILPVFLRYAAVCLLICAASLGSWKLAEKKYSTSSEMIECFVPYGERRSVNLPDGSRIQLNSGTILVYPADFTGKSRTVYLSGEANLAIQKDDRPFILHTGNLIVEVLGTRFNVESYPGSGHITTTLEEGSVKLYKKGDPAGSIRLKPNEQLTYLSHEEAFHIRRNVNIPDYSAWTKGNLHFINEPLDEGEPFA